MEMYPAPALRQMASYCGDITSHSPGESTFLPNAGYILVPDCVWWSAGLPFSSTEYTGSAGPAILLDFILSLSPTFRPSAPQLCDFGVT